MFSKELENLINATLEDGVLEEYEKAALVKRAQAEGVDIAELEIYINSILQKRQREADNERKAQYAKAEQKKKEAFGRVCPACGRQVPSMTLKCECGYEFTPQKQTSSIKVLLDKLDAINQKSTKMLQNREGKDNDETHSSLLKEKLNVITMFPVPNTKEDIIEFLSIAMTSSKKKGGIFGSVGGRCVFFVALALIVFVLLGLAGGGEVGLLVGLLILGYGLMFSFVGGQDVIRENKIAQAWRDKFDQVMLKGRSLRGDAEFTQQLDYYESLLNQKK